MNAFLNNDDFDSRLKDLAENAETGLPEGSWERLQLKREKQDHKRKIRFWMYFSLSTVVLFVVTMILYDHLSVVKNNSGKNPVQYTKSDISIPGDEKNQHDEIKSTKVNDNPLKQEIAENNPSIKNETYLVINGSEKPVIKENENDQKTNIELMLPEKNEDKILINYLSDEYSETTFIVRDADRTKDSLYAAELTKRGDTATSSVKINELLTQNQSSVNNNSKLIGNEIHIGLACQWNVPWILNQNTYGEFSGKELAYKFGFGTAYGITVGYDVQKRYGVQTGIIIHSRQGQKYHDTFSQYGTVDREVALDYFHIPVLYKLKRPLNDKTNPAILNIVAGLQYGHLKKATETLNGVSTDITERFNRNEIGFVFNIESDIYFANSFYFTLGLNSSLGSNINHKDWEQYVSHSNGHSYNMLVGAVCGLSYYFPSK